MWIQNFFRCLTGTTSHRRPTRRRPSPARLRVEALEDRCVPAAMLAIGDVSVLEGNGGTHNAVVAVTLTEPHGNSITVGYRTADGTAIAGSDYNAVSGKLTFARNEMSKSILVPVIGDRTPEADKTFFVRLSNPKGAKIADGEGIVTIVEDEPRISISDAWSYGDMSPFTFTVSLSAAYDQAVTVNFATADGTALAGVDYVATSGTLTFAPGETTKTITVAVIDTTAAPDKWFTVHLSSASTNALIGNEGAYGYWYYDYGAYDYGGYDYGGYYGWGGFDYGWYY